VRGLFGLAALAGRAGVPGVRPGGNDGGHGPGVALWRLPQTGVADCGDDLPGHSHTVDRVVRRGVVHEHRPGRGVGVDDAETARAGLLPDGVDDAAPLPECDGATRPSGPDRAGRGR